MMPGLRSFSHVSRVAPAVDTVSSLRLGRLNGAEQKRDQQPLAHQQQNQPSYRVGSFDHLAASPFAALKQQQLTRQHLEQNLLEETTITAPQPAPQRISGSQFSAASSGSEHEPSSECLAALVSDFMEVDERTVESSWRGHGRAGLEETDDDNSNILEIASSIETVSSSQTALESVLFQDVVRAVRSVRRMPRQEGDSQQSGAVLRRTVMTALRALGYNAAVCKSRWDHSRGFPGGDYEYIDVVFSSESSPIPRERLLVDLDFRAQFQVARPTSGFEAALSSAPAIFVGRAERLQQLVEMLSEACRKSLRVQGMHLPPWRKCEYLRAKWLAPYKRTTNPHAAVATPLPTPAAKAYPAPAPQAKPCDCSQPVQMGFPAVTRSGFVAPRRTGGAPKGVLGMLLQERRLADGASPAEAQLLGVS